MKIRYVLMVIWLLFYGLYLYGQEVNTTLLISPPYSTYLSDYLEFENQAVLTVQNNTGEIQQIFLKGSVEGDNGIEAHTEESYLPLEPITLDAFEVRMFLGGDPELSFFHLHNIETNLDQPQQNNIVRTGILPEGQYQICVEAFDFQTLERISLPGTGCAFVQVTLALPPEIISPMEGDSLTQLPIFSWTPPLGAINGADWTYELIILPLNDVQNPYDAMELAQDYNAGNPIIITDLKSTTYSYGPADVPLLDGPYAVRVQAVDDNQMNQVENDGNSDIRLFYLGEELWSPGEEEITPYSLTLDSNGFDNVRVSGQLFYKFKEDESLSTGMVTQIADISALPSDGISNQGSTASNLSSSKKRNSDPNFDQPSETKSLQNESIYDQSMVPGPGQIVPVKPWGNHKYWKHDWTNTTHANPLANLHVKLEVHTVMHNVTITSAKGVPLNEFDYLSIPGDYISNMAEVLLQGAGATKAETTTASDGSFTLEGLIHDSLGVIRHDFQFTQKGLDAGIWAEIEFFDPGINEVINPHDEYTSAVNNPSVLTDLANGQNQGGNVAIVQNSLLNSLAGGFNLNGFAPDQGGHKTMANIGPSVYEGATYHAATAYNALRIIVESPYYCSPDVEIFAIPGDQLDLPPLTSYVQSFQLTTRVKADDSPDQAVAGKDISDAIVELVRPFTNGKIIHPDIPDNEGEQLTHAASVDGYKLISKGRNANTVLSDPDMEVVFTRLVKHVSATPYELIANTDSLKGDLNYKTKQQPLLFPPSVPYEFNQTFELENLEANVVMEPDNARIAGLVKVVEGQESVYLDGVEVELEMKVGGHTSILKRYTDNNGYFAFNDIAINSDGYEAQTPYYKIVIDHPGYEVVRFPENGFDQLWKGTQLYREFDLEPLGEVAGFVENEFGEPIMAFVRVENGPYAKTELIWSWMNYLNKFSNNYALATIELVKHFPLSLQIQPNSIASQSISAELVNADTDPNSGPVAQSDLKMHQATQKAAFKVKAQSGQNLRLVIEPLSTQYFRDTFLVDVFEKEDHPNQILGTFQVRERKHRIQIIAKDFGGNPIPGVSVHIDNWVKNTNSNGQAFFVFGTPETEFHVQLLPEGNFIKVDTFMVIHPSKDFTVLEFTLAPASYMEGYVKSLVDSLPIEGARVAHVMHIAQYGEVTIETTTDANGYYKLEGLPMSMQPLDFIATKYDPDVTYVGQTKSVAGMLIQDFLNQKQKFGYPKTDFYLQRIDDLNLTGIWGFDLEVKSYIPLSNGKASISGDLINIPGNIKFAPDYPELRISFKNLLIQPSGETDANGISYAEPVTNSFKTQMVKFPLKLYGDFDATLQNFSEPSGRDNLFVSKLQYGTAGMNEVITQNINSNPDVVGSQEILQLVHGTSMSQNVNAIPGDTPSAHDPNTAAGPEFYSVMDAAVLGKYKDWIGQGESKPTIVIKRDSSGTGFMEGYVLNELSSFNFTYYYTGKFYLGDSPSDGIVEAIRADGQMAPSNYSLMVVKGTTPSNAFFDFEKFPAHIDKNYSYVTPDTFNLFTVLHTAIPQSTPSDLAINAGMIKVLKNDILPLAESDYKINFSLGNWKFESLGGWKYDKNVSGILIDSAVIKTKFIDVKMNDIILYPDKPIGDLDDINAITLAGVGKLDLTPDSKALLGYNATVQTWDINIVNQANTGPVAFVTGLPGFGSGDKVFFKEIVMRSNDQNIISLKEETYSVYNIMNFTALTINSGDGFFQLRGGATLPIPGMQPVSTTLEFTGNPGSQELDVHAIKAVLETTGQVQFRFDQWGPAQSMDWNEFRTYGTFRIYEDQDTILLRGELTHINGQCKIEMIKINPGVTYTSAGFDFQPGSQDQRISLNGGKNMIVRYGTQPVVGMQWDVLEFYANMEGYQGAQSNQDPMKFTVHGGMEVTDSEVKLDGIETPFGDFSLAYNFKEQVLIGQLTFQNMSFGAVNQMSGFMGFFIGAPGFMVNGAADGIYPVIGQLKVGFIVGAYQGLPAQAVSDVLEYCKMKKLPPHLAAGNIAGLFLTVNKPLWELHESIVILPELLEGSIDSEAGVDARIWMNFEGGFSFELGVLLYGNIKAMAQVAFCELCLGFAIEGGFAVSYNDYEGAGFKACLSAALSGSIDCGLVSGEFQLAKAVQFSATESGGTNVQVVDGDSCSGDMQTLCSLVAYDQTQDPDAQNQNQN